MKTTIQNNIFALGVLLLGFFNVAAQGGNDTGYNQQISSILSITETEIVIPYHGGDVVLSVTHFLAYKCPDDCFFTPYPGGCKTNYKYPEEWQPLPLSRLPEMMMIYLGTQPVEYTVNEDNSSLILHFRKEGSFAHGFPVSGSIYFRFYNFIGLQFLNSYPFVTRAVPLSAGEIKLSNTNPIPAGTLPQAIVNVHGAVGGFGYTYTYQWKKKAGMDAPVETIPGATSATYQPTEAINTNMFFRREVMCLFDIASTPWVEVPVSITPGQVIPFVQSAILPGETPASLSVTGCAGGRGTYTYQWEQKNHSETVYSIAGATSSTYQSPPIQETTYFRCEVSCGNHHAYTEWVTAGIAAGPGTTDYYTSAPNLNYIVTCTPFDAVNDIRILTQRQQQQASSVAYYDGLGRPLQTVLPLRTPMEKDLVSGIAYDNMGRDHKQYLPTPVAGTAGAYIPAGDFSTAQETFFGTDASRAYSENRYEPSPLNRVAQQVMPGAAWSDHPVQMNYSANTTALASWRVDSNDSYVAVTYPKNSLYVNETVDANGNATREYKDKQDCLIMTEQYDGSQWLRTRYVYDDFGLKRAVVPPQASSIDDEAFCYYYKYDHRHRCVDKKIPGADCTYYVYDKMDRLCYSQDGNQRAGNWWMSYSYDQLNRLDTKRLAGTLGPLTREYLQQADENNLVLWLRFQFHSRTTYDTYPDLPETLTFAVNSTIAKHAANNKGRVTVQATGVLSGGNFEIGMLHTVYYYDDYGKVVQQVSENLVGGTDRISTQYDFRGNILQTRQESTWRDSEDQLQSITLRRTVEYDAQKRPIAVKLLINNRLSLQIARMEYDELGRVKVKQLHNGLDTITYAYNIHNWVKKITGTLFTEELYYEQALGNAAPQYNGNISAQTWATPAQGEHAYTFSYDGVNRLTGTQYKAGNGNFGQLNTEQLTYNKNGNILTLRRYDENGLMDNLVYAYTGNQVSRITDAATVAGFPPRTIYYAHDANGNIIEEGDVSISYNFLNFPEIITRPGGRELRNIYAADGRKLATIATEGNELLDGTKYYNGNLVFDKNGDLEYILMDEGRILVSNYRTPHLGVIIESPFFSDWQAPNTPNPTGSTSFVYEYHLKDHLGSVRVAFTPTSSGKTVVQENAYYPFGAPINDLSYNAPLSDNKYKRESKEYIDAFGWNKYDFGARTFDPWTLRALQIDPLYEAKPWLSPYNLFSNNPVNKIDPDGKLDDWVRDLKTDQYGWMDNVTSASSTPEEFVYVGADDKDILTDMGVSAQYGTKTSNGGSLGFVGGDGVGPLGNGIPSYTHASVSANLSIQANVSYKTDNATENNKYGRTFEGVTVTANVNERTASTNSDLNPHSGGKLSVTSGNKNYEGMLHRPTGSHVYGTGTKPTTASVFIPASEISFTYLQGATVGIGYTNPGVRNSPATIQWYLQTITMFRPIKTK